MKKRFLAVILALCTVLPLLPLSGVFSFAENGVLYYDEKGEARYYTGAFNEKTESTWGVDGQTSWYYVNETLTLNRRLSFRGDVRLILGNEALVTFGDLSAPHPFEVASYSGRSLTVYAQSKDKNTCGKMILNCFGSEGYRGLGTITINGGNIESVAIPSYTYVDWGGDYVFDSAGIGYYSTYTGQPRYEGGSITINGGFIKAVGSDYSAGIGGSFGSSVKTITINGGEIEARGGYGAPGIGTGYNCGTKNEECVVNINGGTVTAVGGDGAPGIGSGFKATNNLTVNITGGVINATAGKDSQTSSIPEKYIITETAGGAGIGCGAFTHGDVTVNISGGNVTASATQGAGIGGSNVNVGNVSVNITGGTVNATASRGAGIGTGYLQNYKNLNNGKVTNVNISGGDVTAFSTNGAGIGSGEVSKCQVNVSITDGKVNATSSHPAAKGIGDGLSVNTPKANVTLSWTRFDSSIYADSYNDNTVMLLPFRDVNNVNPRVIGTISEAAGTTIRPFVYDHEFGSDEGLYLEMTGCEKKYLDEYLDGALLPFLEDQMIYVVDKDMTYQMLIVTGTTVLYLRENATLTVTDGIYVINDEAFGTTLSHSGNLIVVAEKEDSGKLVVGPSSSGAAIGSYVDAEGGVTYSTGLIRVYSGTVEAHGGEGCPAIGGKNLTFSQYGGAVKAYGGNGAPGVGAFPGQTEGVTIDLDGGRLTARGGSAGSPMGLGGANAAISVSWSEQTDAFDIDPCVGTVTIDAGKEFKYLNSSPVRAADASDFASGGVFVPHTSTYYVDADGNRRTVDDYFELSNEGNAAGSITAVDGGWYVCVNDRRNPLQIGTITVNGTMNLILTDGTEMRPVSIVVNPGSVLNIYGQSDGTGLIRTANYGDGVTGIGGSSANTSCGTINIYGGKIVARGTKYASAIGGAGLSGNGGTINIYGGDVTAISGSDGSHGMGGGFNQSTASVNFYGGRITADSIGGDLHFFNYFFYEDDGTRAFEEEYDPARTIVPGTPEIAGYTDENGEAQSTCDYKPLRGGAEALTGVYYVFEDVTLTGRPRVLGEAILILKDGVTLTAPLGIGVNEGNSLKIYANSQDENIAGALNAGPANALQAGIGGDGYQATGSQDENYADSLGSGQILIAGGKITVTGGAGAAAIGAGASHYRAPKDTGAITVTGGFITATGDSGPAIGAGSNVKSAVIHISGGVITANGGAYAAGIGASSSNSIGDESIYSFEIVISGGRITAKGGFQGITNIGAVYGGTTVTVSGGQIDVSDTGKTAFGVGHTKCDSVTVTADDPDLELRYSRIAAANILIAQGLAYSDGRAVTSPPEQNRTIVNMRENFAAVTFEPSNGEAPSVVYAALGGRIIAPEEPTPPEGYHFVGWFDEEHSIYAFDFSEDTVAEDVTLTAHYEKNVYTVTFDPANGEEPFEAQVPYADAVAAPSDPITDHASFDGWFEADAETPYDFETPVTGNLTLTARWTFDVVTVVFRDGNGEETLQEVRFGQKPLEPEVPVRQGYAFIGWRTENAINLFDFDTPLTDDLELYAVWAFGSYITLDGTDGANYDESCYNLLDFDPETKWCVTGFEGCYIEFSTEKYLVPEGFIMTTANDTASSPDRNPVSFTLSGRNGYGEDWTVICRAEDDRTLGAVNETPYIFSVQCDEQYRFFRLEIDEVASDESWQIFQLADFSLMANETYDVPEYVVTFDAGQGQGSIENITALKGDKVSLYGGRTLTPPAGMLFSHWECLGERYDENDEIEVDRDLTVTAVYDLAYELSFTDGVVTEGPFLFVNGETVVLPGNVFGFTPPNDNSAFSCWALGDRQYDENDPYVVAGNALFTAVWKDCGAWIALNEQLSVLEEGEEITIVLTDDCFAPEDADALTIPEGVSVTIDLAGHTVDRGLKSGVNNGMVFLVYGSLTVCDSSPDESGVITGGFNNGDGGGVYVADTGVFTLTGGTITGNTAHYGGGVEANGALIMKGGTITGNKATYGGGGVEIYSDGCSVTLSGGARIFGNYCFDPDQEDPEAASYENNVLLYENQIILIGGAFTSSAHIGVTMYNLPSEGEMSPVTEGLGGAGASAFFSDDAAYSVVLNEEGEAALTVFAGIYGDVNEDGNVDILDVTALLDALSGKKIIDPALCDLNGDHDVDILDVSVLLDYLSGN